MAPATGDAVQLVLDIATAPSYAAEDFVSGEANAAARLLVSELAWPTPVGVLVGEPGSGKTHLASIAAHELGPAVWAAPALPLPPLDGVGLVILDGLERWCGAEEDELFHALEAARAAAVPVLATCHQPPEALGLARPDTVSRLRAGQRATIAPPDDRLFTAIAVKQFTDRQLAVDPDIAHWLLQRMERSYANLARLVARLDAQSLAHGRSITRALARDVLAAWDMS